MEEAVLTRVDYFHCSNDYFDVWNLQMKAFHRPWFGKFDYKDAFILDEWEKYKCISNSKNKKIKLLAVCQSMHDGHHQVHLF